MQPVHAVSFVIGAAIAGLAAARADSRVVRPCKPGTAEHRDAEARLADLDVRIRRLAPADVPSLLIKRLEELGRGKCFEILDGLSADAKNGLALRTWWEEGGHSYAASALELGGKYPVAWVVPSVRRTLTRETSPGHRLSPLLCPAYDENCGRETEGWRMRAQAVLDRGARLRQLESKSGSSKGARPPPGEDCESFARKAPPRQRFARFRDCLVDTAERPPQFPIGRVRKPTEGWLVVSGRRGHYGFCDELRAFDLSSGAAYRVASCSGLALRSGGSVDHRATDAGRNFASERGMVALDQIREATWMLLLVGEMDSAVTSSFGQALPDGVVAEVEVALSDMLGFVSRTFSMSSAETRLTWRVTGLGAGLGAGDLTWPRDLNDDAEAQAAELLEIAETSFTPGCPAAKPPADLEKQLQGLSAHRLDTDATSLGTTAGALQDAWRKLLNTPCETGR